MELTLRPSRLKYLTCAALCAAGLACSLLGVKQGDPECLIAMPFCALGVIGSCLLLLPRSSYLRLDPWGFTLHTLFRSATIRWYEVDSFEVVTIETTKVVVFNFSKLYLGHKTASKLLRRIGGYDGALVETYGLVPEEFAAMMNEWRQHGSPCDMTESMGS